MNGLDVLKNTHKQFVMYMYVYVALKKSWKHTYTVKPVTPKHIITHVQNWKKKTKKNTKKLNELSLLSKEKKNSQLLAGIKLILNRISYSIHMLTKK